MDVNEHILIMLQENIQIEWLLCSPQFDDIILIAPEGLNIPIDFNYKEVWTKSVLKTYFNHHIRYLSKINMLKQKWLCISNSETEIILTVSSL